jgi:hypothetical protein
MTKIIALNYEGTELAWLRAGLTRPMDDGQTPVSDRVPAGFAAYLRVFHRFEAADSSGRTRTWRALAQEARVPFHAETCERSLPLDTGVDGEPLWVTDPDQPDAATREALVRCLDAATGDQPVFFAYDSMAVLWGVQAPLIRRSTLAGLDDVRRSVAAEVCDMPGPEFWWPHDRSWVVTSDMVSTYVGCSAEVAERILGDEEIEALPVTPRTRVDCAADAANHRLRHAEGQDV